MSSGLLKHLRRSARRLQAHQHWQNVPRWKMFTQPAPQCQSLQPVAMQPSGNIGASTRVVDDAPPIHHPTQSRPDSREAIDHRIFLAVVWKRSSENLLILTKFSFKNAKFGAENPDHVDIYRQRLQFWAPIISSVGNLQLPAPSLDVLTHDAGGPTWHHASACTLTEYNTAVRRPRCRYDIGHSSPELHSTSTFRIPVPATLQQHTLRRRTVQCTHFSTLQQGHP